MTKTKKLIYLPLIVFFLFAQSIFLNHQLEPFEEVNHSESCFVCLIDSSNVLSLSQNIPQLPVFEKKSSFQKYPFIFVKSSLYSQSLPRSPPLV